ncbi:MAG: phospholipase D family protein [Clostridiales bacterium]|nr:phospholipase D family protein [Clostridiales bacterium]
MFKPNGNEDRRDYGQLLMPPDGFRLEMAVGTTYSLDLESLAAVAISLGISEDMDSELLQNPICMLHALQKVSDKVMIFCEAGQIKMPENPSVLSLLVEKMVIPVALPKDKKMGIYPAFHPKTWILSYYNDAGERRYRFVVMSRNLTFDRSWDVSFAMDGTVERVRDKKTAPIIYFLKFLTAQIPDDWREAAGKRSSIRGLIRELQNVSFSLDSREFGEDFEVLPMGIGKYGYDMSRDVLFCDEKYTADSTFNELVIMSPFLSGSIIESFNQNYHSLTECKRTLITRRSELEKLKPEQADNFDIYVLRDEMVDGEDYLSDESVGKSRQDIHAKIFLRRKYADTDLYVGSMNASHAALHNNVEMMVRLRTKNRYLNGETFLKDIFCGPADGDGNPFEKVSIPDAIPEKEEDRRKVLETKIKEICRLNKTACADETDAGKYCVRIRIEGVKKDDSIMIAPFRSVQRKPLNEKMVFENLDLLKLSEFYEITAMDEDLKLHRVIMIPTTGIPEERDSAVVNSVVKDRSAFVEYVAYVLGDNYLSTLMEEKQLQESGLYRQSGDAMPALYEKMLRVSLEEPERLNDIRYVLDMITDTDIIPQEFRDTYEIFCKTPKIPAKS